MAEPAAITPTPGRPRPIGALAAAAARVLDAARGLTMPIEVSVYGPGEHVSMQFTAERGSYDTIAAWAELFGATLTSHPWHDKCGAPVNICGADFDYDGIAVRAFAVIPAATAIALDQA